MDEFSQFSPQTERFALKGTPNYCDRFGRNALHMASLCSAPTAVTADIVRLLINKNVSVSKSDRRYEEVCRDR